MSKYEELFFPATNTLNVFNQNMVFVIMLIVGFGSIFYIIHGIKHLKLISKNRDHSLRQNSFILFKIISMLFLVYVIYEIANIILSMS